MISVHDRPVTDAPEAEAAPAKKRGGGPKTPEGKENSKRNAMTHGLRAKLLVPEELAEVVAERTAQLAEEFGPETMYEGFLVDEMARATVRLDRCAELAIADLRRCVNRATLCWDDDRMMSAEDLGARLPKDPARVSRALLRSRQGVQWTIVRWEGLRDVLKSNGGWDEAQRRLAFDLLGVPLELRNGSVQVPPEADTKGLNELVERQLALLRGRCGSTLDELDEAMQVMAAAGMPMEEDAATARLRKYEAGCRRALIWAQIELRRVREEASPGRESQRSETRHAEESATPSPPLSAPFPEFLPIPSEAVVLAEEAEGLHPTSDTEVLPVVETPVVLPPPPSNLSYKSASKSAAPLNRRQRRAQERLARQAAR